MTDEAFRAEGFAYRPGPNVVTLPTLPLDQNSGAKQSSGIQLEILRNRFVNITTVMRKDSYTSWQSLFPNDIDELIAALEYAKQQIKQMDGEQ